MISYRISFVGFQLLLLSYTAQSFVLLTANIDDIKKLARKFVSDSLADKLTDFVVKATEQMTDQMQETPSQKIIKSHAISASNEHEIRNLDKDREEEKQQTIRQDRHDYTTRKEERQKPNYLSNESKELSIEKEERLLENEKKWQKNFEESKDKEKSVVKNWRDEFEKSKEFELPIQTKPKPYWSMEKKEMAHNDVFSQELLKNSYYSQYGNKDEKNKEHYQSKQSESFYKESHNDRNELKQYSRLTTPDSHLLTFKSPKTQKSESKLDERISDSIESPSSGSRYKKIKDRDTKTLSFDFKLPKSQKQNHDDRKYSAESLSDLKIKYNKDRDFKPARSDVSKLDKDRLWDMATTRFRGLPNVDDGVTTKKEKTDFDQYDNRNYPKADFIATSGPLMLPRMSPNYYKQPKSQEKAWWEKDFKLHDNVAQLKTWLATI